MRAALIVLAICATAASASASPSAELRRARDYFRAKDFESARPLLKDLLYPPQLAQPTDLVEAHVLLGVCYFETGNRGEAKSEFEQALDLEPGKTLDTLLFSSGAVRLFDETREDIEQRKKRESELRKLEEERERLKQARENTRAFETHPYYVNFVPFGAGQFQDHRNARGVLFAAAEGATFGTSAGIWLYLVGRYGLVCPSCVALRDASRVKQLQQVEVVSGAAFVLVYLVGVADSLYHYKPRAQLDELPPELLRQLDDKRPKPKKTSFRDRVHLAPMIMPTGLGIGLGWEN